MSYQSATWLDRYGSAGQPRRDGGMADEIKAEIVANVLVHGGNVVGEGDLITVVE